MRKKVDSVNNNNKQQQDIAIIGMSCVFPQAPSLTDFWHNVVNGVDTISEPVDDWDAKRYLSNERIKTQFGGFLKDLYQFDPRDFGIMPSSVDGSEPDQFLALRVAAEALKDAGYAEADIDHSETGVVLGHSTYMHRGQVSYIQHHIVLDQTIEIIKNLQPELDESQLAAIRQAFEQQLPSKETDITPGLVPNVMTGRIANRLNLKGPNYILDAACSSSLLAINAAVDELRNGRSRMMLAGGVNATMPAEAFIMFTQLGALSGRGKVRAFEKGSDGTLLGEGLGIICLKCLDDAIADGDRIYAVIKGLGQSSDGKGQGLLAPSEEGETLAIKRAYESTNIDPASIGMIEAHGTGIPLGDKTEIASLKNVLGKRKGEFGSVALGSVKSMISHCIPAAGVAGVIKSALALHHKVLPPTLCDEVNPELQLESTSLYVNTELRPWLANSNHPRRVGVNSFGFGGINAHAILEEAPESKVQEQSLMPQKNELFVFSAKTAEKLLSDIQQVSHYCRTCEDVCLADIAISLSRSGTESGYRAAVMASSVSELMTKLDKLTDRVSNNPEENWSMRSGIYYCAKPLAGKVAFIFPGEGSQYLNMLSELCIHFSEVREWFSFWKGLYTTEAGSARTDYLFPPKMELNEAVIDALEEKIHSMDVGSEAVFIGGQAMFSLLNALGVKADVMLGHSSGESSSLAASGALGLTDKQALGKFIRQLNKKYKKVLSEDKIPTGALLAVGALDVETIESIIDKFGGEIHIAMENCKNQKVLYGSQSDIQLIEKQLSKVGGICAVLPFDRGYHTPHFEAMTQEFVSYYKALKLSTPAIPLYSCASADRFPEDSASIQDLAAKQWSNKVRFNDVINKMHDDGVRYFIEVGPSANLTAFVNDILAKKDYVALPSNLKKGSSLEYIQSLLARLFVNEKLDGISYLNANRKSANIDFEEISIANKKNMAVSNLMPVLKVDSHVKNLFSSFKQHGDWHVNKPPQNNSAIEQQVLYSKSDSMPFLSKINAITDNSLEASCHLNIFENAFLQDHVISGDVADIGLDETEDRFGLSCVPLMVSVEIMAEACSVISQSFYVSAIENIQAYDWIALDKEEVILTVKARRDNANKAIYYAEIFNEDRRVVSGYFYFSDKKQLQTPDLLPANSDFNWAQDEYYTTGMFHGPIFQSIEKVDAYSEKGIDAFISSCSLQGFFADDELAELVLNPVLLDAFGQLIAFWLAQNVGTDFNSFPSVIKRIDLWDVNSINLKGAKLCARRNVPNNQSLNGSWDISCLDTSGNVIIHAQGWQNVYFPVPNRFYQLRHDPLHAWLGGIHQNDEETGLLIWRIEYMDDSFLSQSNEIFLKVLAFIYLNEDERDEWLALTSSFNYRKEWLFGRACIKEAVRFAIYKETKQLLYPSDIEVLHDQMGAPYVDGWWQETLITAPQVSLSHDKHRLIAAVSFDHEAVGVDSEQIGRISNPSLVMPEFNDLELTYLQQLDGEPLEDRLLRMWCSKEAAAKFLGTGLAGNPRSFSVSFLNEDFSQAEVDSEFGRVNVSIARDGKLIVAVAAETL